MLKRQQAAERMRLYRDRKRRQQSTQSVISDDELTTPPHTDQPDEPTGKPTIRQLCATTRGSWHFVTPSFSVCGQITLKHKL
jgi:tRNA A37 threonylcarbamoyladenosine dehydratase